MNSFFATANIATYTVILIGGLVVISLLWTLIGWVVFPREPLRWNTEARLEAAQTPANLLAADRAFRQQRFITRILLLVAAILICYQVAPTQTQAAIDAVFGVFAEVFRVLRSNLETMAAARGG